MKPKKWRFLVIRSGGPSKRIAAHGRTADEALATAKSSLVEIHGIADAVEVRSLGAATAYRPPKTVAVRAESEGVKSWWTREELRYLLRRSRKSQVPMPESTFKTRLALLEEHCPEIERQLYSRKFSDMTKWALLTIESWLRKCNYDMTKIQKKLENEGLPTHEYYNNKS